MTHSALLINIYGVIPILIACTRYLHPTRRGLLTINIALAVSTMIQYFLLHEVSGMVIAGLTAITSAMNAFGFGLSVRVRLIVAFIAIGIAMMVSRESFSHWWAFLPLVAFTASRLAELSQDNLRVRLFFLPGHLMWLVYGICIESWAIIALEVVTIVMNLWSVRRLVRERSMGTAQAV